MEAVIERQLSSSGKTVKWVVIAQENTFHMASKKAALQLANHLNNIKKEYIANHEHQQDDPHNSRHCAESTGHWSNLDNDVLGTNQVREEHAVSDVQTSRATGDEGAGLRDETTCTRKQVAVRGQETPSAIDKLFTDTVEHLHKERQLASDARQLATDSRQLASDARELARGCLELATNAVSVAAFCYSGSINGETAPANQRALEPTTIEVVGRPINILDDDF